MFRSLVYIVFLATTISSCNSRRVTQPVAKKIFSHDAIETIENVRKTVEEVFPDGSIPIYHIEKDLVIGVAEDFKNDRILIIRPDGWDGELEIKCNGELIAPPFEELKIKIHGRLITESGTEEYKNETHEVTLGYLIPLTKKDSLALSAELIHPAHCSLTVSYTSLEGWTYTVVFKK